MSPGDPPTAACPDCGKPVNPEQERLCRSCGYPLFLQSRQGSAPDRSVSRSPGSMDDATLAFPPVGAGNPVSPRPPVNMGRAPHWGMVTCSRCQHANPPDRVRCEQCGNDLRLPAPDLPPIPPAPPPSSHRRPRRGTAIAVGVAAAVIAAAVVATKVIKTSGHSGGGTAASSSSSSAVSSSKPPPPPLVNATAIAGKPHAAQVVQTLTLYFSAVNAHDVAKARTAFTPSSPAKPALDNSLSTTKDDEIAVVALRPSGGSVAAVVTFRSHQAPQFGPAPDHAACDTWAITYQFSPQYKIESVPAANHTSC